MNRSQIATVGSTSIYRKAFWKLVLVSIPRADTRGRLKSRRVEARDFRVDFVVLLLSESAVDTLLSTHAPHTYQELFF